MGLFNGLARLWQGGRTVADLATRLAVDPAELREVEPVYRSCAVPKRGGGIRTLLVPRADLKALQRRILRHLLAPLPAHPAATAFERGRSTIHNALPHAGRPVVIRLDLVDFFPSIKAERIRGLCQRLGWGRAATDLLVRALTYEGGLPQGAPTSPRLSNLVNLRLDRRLQGLADKVGAAYTRYADDITLSLDWDDGNLARRVLALARRIVREEGYRPHRRRKVSIRRAHQRQLVTGLVVNHHPALPREVRRWLRAVRHRHATGGAATLSRARLAGWTAYEQMVARHANSR